MVVLGHDESSPARFVCAVRGRDPHTCRRSSAVAGTGTALAGHGNECRGCEERQGSTMLNLLQSRRTSLCWLLWTTAARMQFALVHDNDERSVIGRHRGTRTFLHRTAKVCDCSLRRTVSFVRWAGTGKTVVPSTVRELTRGSCCANFVDHLHNHTCEASRASRRSIRHQIRRYIGEPGVYVAGIGSCKAGVGVGVGEGFARALRPRWTTCG